MQRPTTMGRVLWVAFALFLGLGALAAAAAAQGTALPKVRAITAFVRVGRHDMAGELQQALTVLHAAKLEFEHRGYEVQTLRIVTQPLGELVQGLSDDDALAFLKSLDQLSVQQGFMANVGPAMLRDDDDPHPMMLLARALATLPHLNASAITAADDGIHWKVIHQTAALVRYVSTHSPHSQGTFNFAATAMLAPYGPFYPGAYHQGAGHQLSIGLEAANLVQAVLPAHAGDFAAAEAALTRELTVHARAAEAVGNKVAAASGWSFMGVDPTPAPMGDVSIAAAIEGWTGAHFGGSGTLTAALLITRAVKAVPVKQIGYSGLMLPVMEDKVLARRWAENTFNADALLAYSAVCATGLDTVPYPGDISEAQLARIYGDVAALAFKWHKPLAARLQPVAGLKAGEHTDFDSPYLFNTTLHPLP